MSDQENSTNKPKMKAGDEIINSCPVCNSSFQESVATNVNHKCPNPICGKTFCVMVFD